MVILLIIFSDGSATPSEVDFDPNSFKPRDPSDGENANYLSNSNA